MNRGEPDAPVADVRPKCEKSRNWGTMLSAQHPFMRPAAREELRRRRIR